MEIDMGAQCSLSIEDGNMSTEGMRIREHCFVIIDLNHIALRDEKRRV